MESLQFSSAVPLRAALMKLGDRKPGSEDVRGTAGWGGDLGDADFGNTGTPASP